MRYRLAALMLMAVLLLMCAMTLPAAPVPEHVSAVLDIGPPPESMTADEFCKQAIRGMTHPRGGLWDIKNNAVVKKLPSFARLKKEEVDPWLAKNLRIKEEKGGRHLRLTFWAGTRAEQVTILNALLQAYTAQMKQTIKPHEEVLQLLEKQASDCARNSKTYSKERELWQKREAGLKVAMAPIKATIAQLRQIAVVKWAK
jgi:hypothetical protein